MSKQFFRSRGLLALGVSLAFFSVTARAQAADVTTDNGSPFTTATGFEALANPRSTGLYNTASGYQALRDNGGNNNTATGFQALRYNTTGSENTADGVDVLWSNTTGSGNTGVGYFALHANTTSRANTAVGAGALETNTGPSFSTSDTAASFNTAIGNGALRFNTIGEGNTASGAMALEVNTTGSSNTANGNVALVNNKMGSANTAMGQFALFSNENGSLNVASGYGALFYNRGEYNVAVGPKAGCALADMSNNNIAIGSTGVAGDNNVIRIGTVTNSSSCSNNNLSGTLSAHTSTYIAGISGVGVTGAPVYVTTTGQLGIGNSSSLRFKKDVESLGSASEKILGLRPVSFHYRQADEKGDYPLQYGLIAEEVAKVLPDLVQYDKDGAPFAVHYHLLAPLLLGEVQQQHVENRQLREEVASLRSQAADQAGRLAAIEKKLNGLE